MQVSCEKEGRVLKALYRFNDCCRCDGHPAKSIGLVQDVVSAYYGLEKSELLSVNRGSRVSFPRKVAMSLCVDLTDLSTPQVGDSFGGRDHTTVVHAVTSTRKMRETESQPKDDYEYLSKVIAAVLH